VGAMGGLRAQPARRAGQADLRGGHGLSEHAGRRIPLALRRGVEYCGLVGLWLAAAPPDDVHPYGHKKYETLAAASIGAMLVGTCLYLLWTSYAHWLGSVRPQVTRASFVIMLATMGINYGVMRWEQGKGRDLRSEILVADSHHTGSDLLTSCSVFGGPRGGQAGYPVMDPIVAMVIAAIIARTAWLVLAETSQSLTDRARLDPEEVRSVVLQRAGVLDCHTIRTRGLPHHILWTSPSTFRPG